MNLKFHNKRISGILTILPKHEVKFDDELDNYNFTRAQSLKLKLTMGYDRHRIVDDDTCISDLCVSGLSYLFDKALIQKDEIDALILVTQSPDYFMPPTSNIIQGRLGLKQDMICLDINQGCAGFIIGLVQAFMLLEQEEINKVVLLNADILSRKVSKKDRNSNPLIGDAASVTIIEKSGIPNEIICNIKMNGADANVLMIPAGGFRMPSNERTAMLKEDASGNMRALDNLVMKGDEVFNFVQREVPPLVEDLLIRAGVKKDDIDYFMFHQPNKFMLNKLADKLGVPRTKMPANIVENFGNASGVSVPTVITYNLGKRLIEESFKLCLAGFGVGLTWVAMLIEAGKLKFCEIYEY